MDPSVEPSDPKPLRLPDDLRTRLCMVWKNDTARAIVMAAAIAALFTLASYQDNHMERRASAPACDGESCRDTVGSATPTGSIPTAGIPAVSISTASIPTAGIPEPSMPLTSIIRQTPNIGRVPNEDRTPPPAPDADRHRPQPAPGAKSNPPSIVTSPGIVTSRKTGARARVGVAYAARFQAYVDDLERNHGARVLFMGGVRPGHCASHSMHPCGKALDVCQLSRGVVDARCHLPPRRTLAQIAAAHGLFEGGRWCNSDYGHAQFGVTAADCGDRGTRIVRRQMAPEAGRRASAFSFE